MLSQAHFQLFEKYKDAGAHAFSTGIVSESDKDLYQELFISLINAAKQSIDTPPLAQKFGVLSTRFFRNGGVQGQRPVDLWASIINNDSAFGRYPQVYVIASSEGFE